jgi:hypothetical protein
VTTAVALVFGLAAGVGPALAQQAAAPPAPPPAAATGPVADSDDLTALVAPVALYPDPLLSVILQASTLPLQVVQAERFLHKRAKDPSLKPDPDWDPSILALANYPQLVEAMSEYVDWTEELGNAVLDRLEDVQVAIQELRWAAYTQGILKSDEALAVTAEGNVIAIEPAKDDAIRIPKYDPEALLAALEPVEEAPAAAVPAQPAATPAPAQAPAAPAPAAATAPPAPAPPAPAPVAEAPVAPAPAAVDPAAYAAAPAYAPAPTYAAAPVVSYSEPQSSFWSGTATFLGGAAVGGLLGYMLADDDDDDDDDDGGCNKYCWDDDWDGDDWDDDWNGKNENYKNNKINIEDNTIIVADNEKLKRNLNNRRNKVQPRNVGGVGGLGGLGGVGGVGGPGGADRPGGRQEIAALPAAGTQARRDVGTRAQTQAAPRASRDVRLPAPAGRPQGAEAARPTQKVASPEHRQKAQGASQGRVAARPSAGLTGTRDGKAAAEAQTRRGAQSRQQAAQPRAPQPRAPQPQVAQPQAAQSRRGQAPRPDKGGAGLQSAGSGKRAERESQRGAKSRGGGGGGGGGGRGGRGRG